MRAEKMPEFPLEHFVPNWYDDSSPEEDAEDAKERLRSRMISTLMGGSAPKAQQGVPQLRRKEP